VLSVSQALAEGQKDAAMVLRGRVGDDSGMANLVRSLSWYVALVKDTNERKRHIQGIRNVSYDDTMKYMVRFSL
jgi:hypothetical protein